MKWRLIPLAIFATYLARLLRLGEHEKRSYSFSNFETIYEEGFGLPSDPLNPLVTYNTRLV